MADCYDIGIVGMGGAGATSLLKLVKQNKGLKIATFEQGRPSGKRRHQILGFLGCLPGSDGKLYLNDLESVIDITGIRRTNSSLKWVLEQFSHFSDLSLIKDKRPYISAEKRIKKHGFDISLNNHYQLYPKDIHSLSRFIVAELEKNDNTILSNFDDEIVKILKNKHYFTVYSASGNETNCKKLIVSVGRGGWRWASELFNGFGIIEDNNMSHFGIRVETTTSQMKDFNQSNCSLKKNDLMIGPLSWKGTIIPEDHLDMVVTSFRSNESRWQTDKVSFNIIASKYFENYGYQQMDRIGKLTFILGNDRMMKERLSTLMNGKSKLSVMKEYNWLLDDLKELNNIIPDLLDRGYFYAPTLLPFAPKINIGSDFSTEVKGLYVAGETAGVPGILGAMVSGSICADGVI